MQDITARIIEAALNLGFSSAAVAPAEHLSRGAEALQQWLASGYHGEMDFLTKHGDRADPLYVLPEVRSIVVVALPYPDPAQKFTGTAPYGRVARYARGPDYHHVIRQKLTELATTCEELLGRPVIARPCVDSAPLLEHEIAERAGMGFTAKNTLTIIPGSGSYVSLGELLLDVELPASQPSKPRCGDCTACIDACPTQAFIGPYQLDARRCISYLTIELAGSMPRELRPLVGDHIFGCDVCQDVCPFNAKLRAAEQPLTSISAKISNAELSPRVPALSLEAVLQLTSSAYRRLVRGTALRRVSRHQLARNAAVALGNTHSVDHLPALAHALTTHTSPLVRGHSAWALGHIGGPEARALLVQARASETDSTVLEEVEAALVSCDSAA